MTSMIDGTADEPVGAFWSWLPALAFAALAGAMSLSSVFATSDTGEMAVVFAPGVSELTAWSLLRQAGGLLVAPTALSNIVVAYAPDAGFKDRMRQLGGWFFIPAQGLCAALDPQVGPSS